MISGNKTVTRRQWDPSYALRFKAGEIVLAYDRSPRAHGKPVARLRLTMAPYEEHERDTPDEDYAGEGFAWFDEHPDLIPKSMRERMDAEGSRTLRDLFERARQGGEWVWVVRFEMLEVLV